ncbi:hypothetical protein BGX38DRAFT_1177322 [Terfezia claveryi]|nr:hypothetical protein BGX38DRAFT_1177322 [Terfezia claveryi]
MTSLTRESSRATCQYVFPQVISETTVIWSSTYIHELIGSSMCGYLVYISNEHLLFPPPPTRHAASHFADQNALLTA